MMRMQLQKHHRSRELMSLEQLQRRHFLIQMRKRRRMQKVKENNPDSQYLEVIQSLIHS